MAQSTPTTPTGLIPKIQQLLQNVTALSAEVSNLSGQVTAFAAQLAGIGQGSVSDAERLAALEVAKVAQAQSISTLETENISINADIDLLQTQTGSHETSIVELDQRASDMGDLLNDRFSTLQTSITNLNNETADIYNSLGDINILNGVQDSNIASLKSKLDRYKMSAITTEEETIVTREIDPETGDQFSQVHYANGAAYASQSGSSYAATCTVEGFTGFYVRIWCGTRELAAGELMDINIGKTVFAVAPGGWIPNDHNISGEAIGTFVRLINHDTVARTVNFIAIVKNN